jgi:CelD/BcsL family acetyltransferase involved in cellulose biosynthesis
MRVESKRFSELSPKQLAVWQQLRSMGPGLDSPFFAPGFYRLTSEVYPQTRVAVIESSGAPVCFWPFERIGTRGFPAAFEICEITGMIAADDLDWNPSEVLASLGLSQWSFDCLAAAHEALQLVPRPRVPTPWGATLEGPATDLEGRIEPSGCHPSPRHRRCRSGLLTPTPPDVVTWG